MVITFFSFEQALVGIYERDKEANTMQLSEVLGNAESALTNCGNFVLALDYHPEPNIKTWDRVQADNIKAKFAHGVLEVAIPKQPVVAAKRVTVEAA